MTDGVVNRFCPDVVFPPGDSLSETLETLGMTQAELAERMGRPEKTISEIIKGKTAITPETALQLERVLGVPASLWQNLENEYRVFLARKSEQESLTKRIAWLDTIPVRDMVKLGWIPDYQDKTETLRAVLSFFGVASIESWESLWGSHRAIFRMSVAFESNPGAVAAWLRAGELQGRSIACRPYSQGRFKEALSFARTLTRKPPESFIPQLQAVCAEAGVAVVFVHDLPKTRVSGATQWLSKDKALIQLGLRYKTDDHLWFTFFHEAGHILLHGKKSIFVEEESVKNGAEKEADSFAAEFLIPSKQYQKLLKLKSAGGFKESVVRSFADSIGIAPGIVVGRLQHDGQIPFNKLNGLKVRLEWAKE